MVQVLHAWVCGEYSGRFQRQGSQTEISFIYDPSARTSVSLSIPRESEVKRSAPGNFLAGLIPEHVGARETIRRVTNARSASAWDLLEAIGGDLPGGLVLRPEGVAPSQTVPYKFLASEDEIEDRIIQIKRGGSGYSRGGPPPRFSVAGAQAKFTLARTDFGIYWPDAETVSSHIVKPEVDEHRGLERLEVATLKLANLSGIPAPQAQQAIFGDSTAFQIDRFDRVTNADGELQRVHAEDFTQILGVDPSEKELVDPSEATEVLRRATGSDELGHLFYRQLIFNTLIGNSDAHGKNYSVLHTEDGLRMSPLYDSFPMGAFPNYGADLTMPISAENRHTHVTPDDWAESAIGSGLNPERVLTDVQEIATGIGNSLEETLGAESDLTTMHSTLGGIREALDRSTGVLSADRGSIIDLGSA